MVTSWCFLAFDRLVKRGFANSPRWTGSSNFLGLAMKLAGAEGLEPTTLGFGVRKNSVS